MCQFNTKVIVKIKIVSGLADTTRLSVLESLREGGKTTFEIIKETKHNQSSVSNHLVCLMDFGLLIIEEKKRTYFPSIQSHGRDFQYE